jgi:protein gp37
MAANTTIEWATKSWNPVRGCSRVSPGCDECYAMKFAHRFSGAGQPYEGLTTSRRGKVDWIGVARFLPSELGAPLRWRQPQRIFVNSMSDLFHHTVAFEQIAAVCAVMAAATRHQFLVLTKRPERAIEWFRWLGGGERQRERCAAHALTFLPGYSVDARSAELLRIGRALRVSGMPTFDGHERPWPLPNVWLGVSVENQETADERLPTLLECPAAVRFVSAEPLLGPLDLGRFLPALDWVIVGGESGPGARPFHVEWARSIVTACEAAGVAAFVKQLGASPFEHDAFDVPSEVLLDNFKGGDMAEWPEDLRVREFPRND